ncbi:MAG: right-handed parallel beta-helix repeat-containing protein, partial [Synergistaceae bacterium]|nr:right-handed parallel beta-helix repeat-containing protein [Synergistaceae bacterium]
MKYSNGYKMIGILAVMTALLFTCDAGNAREQKFTAGTYTELHGILKSINPDGADYERYEDDEILIELSADLDVNDLGSALGKTSDEDTGATLTISRPNVTIEGNGHTIASHGYPSFHVEGIRVETADPLGGIVIQNVTVDGAAYELKLGGGMFFENRAEITIRNSTIKNGSAKRGGGGGFYAGPHGSPFGPTVTIENCVFEGNTSAEGNTPEEEWCSSGGAILGYYATIYISDSTFTGNRAPLGGAISLYGDKASLTVTGNSVFDGNEAKYSGGAIHVFYGSAPTSGRLGNSSITTKDISAVVTAEFRNNRANVQGTEDFVFGVAYDPATYADSDIGEPVQSTLTVNTAPVQPTYFRRADRSE